MSARLLLLFAALLLAARPVVAAQVIVHPSVAHEEFSFNMLRLIFAMRLIQWSDGSRIRVFVLADDEPLHREFSKKVVQFYPRQLRRVWDRHRFAGTGQVPVQVENIEAMVERVANTPGAIGYLPDGEVRQGVVVIDVD